MVKLESYERVCAQLSQTIDEIERKCQPGLERVKDEFTRKQQTDDISRDLCAEIEKAITLIETVNNANKQLFSILEAQKKVLIGYPAESSNGG